LVAFLPELLPECSLETKMVLQQVLQEAQTKMFAEEEEENTRLHHPFLRKVIRLGLTRMSVEEKQRKIHGFQLPEETTGLTTFEKGVKLGQKLMELNTDRWEVMADFWAETMLYVAPSDSNAKAHIEQLVKGGEFVTHLWALLSNAGILKRAPHEQPFAPDNA
jgi:hypothetical protein